MFVFSWCLTLQRAAVVVKFAQMENSKICSGRWIDGLIGIGVSGALLAQRRTAAQVCNPGLLVAAARLGFQAGVVRREDGGAAVQVFWSAAGQEAAGVILRSVGQSQVVPRIPRWEAFVWGGGAPALFTRHLCDFLFMVRDTVIFYS